VSTSLVEFPNLIKGLQVPDASAEMVPGSLGIATNCDLTKTGTIKQRFGTAVASDVMSSFQYAFIHETSTTPQLVGIKTDGTGA